jgi:hypothetical protein
LVEQSVEKDAFHPVPRARGITTWSLFRVSRQSLEQEFSEVRALAFGCTGLVAFVPSPFG